MLIAEKANRVVRIADEKKDEYIGMGYTVKNMDGTVIKAPVDPKKKAQELEAELKATKEAAEKQIADLTKELEKAREEASSTSDARMNLLETTRTENEALKAENADLKGKLEEARNYAENADKRITELEAELKKTAAADADKKEAKTKTADK
ncbi:MAG: hypothetical protein HDR09_12955 [Lachnospiraceae bacterium]|nr:hypothetical protein [Lachnospiraceae bacterium]